MSEFPLPSDESERLEALRRYEVLDTPPEEPFDDLARLAALVCGTPMALIDLVDAGRVWLKARVGFESAELPRGDAFCSHAVLEPQRPLVVSDLRRDQRFATNPLVQDGRARFYAGAPLVAGTGHAVGTICVLDREPRSLGPQQIEALGMLSRQVIAQLELRACMSEIDAARREAEAADRGSGEYLAGMAHEITTPPNATGQAAHEHPTTLQRVLYIEDNQANIDLLERFLGRRAGTELHTAMRGEEGLERARRELPDVILLDLHLPDLPGRDVLQRLREHEATRNIPVVVVTANAMAASRRELLSAGATEYLTKPLDLGRLEEVLDDLRPEALRGSA